MKIILLLSLLFICGNAFTRITPNPVLCTSGKGDSLQSSAKSLSATITDGLVRDRDKVRAIFLWITDNIDYRVGSRITGRIHSNNNQKSLAHDFSMPTLDEQVAEIVLRERKAVCDGYARLFKVLCGYAGIRAELVTGYARGYTVSPASYFRSNHTWNAVMIDSAWHLLDVTWASGYINYRKEFVKALDDNYYLSAPATFIRDHYPDDLKWSFVKDPPTLKEFHNAPFKSQGFVLSKIDSYYPGKGIIETSLGEVITIELTTRLSPGTARQPTEVDSLRLTHKSVALAAPKISGQKLLYTYKVDRPDTEWLHIFFNEQEIMRYRVDIKENNNPQR